MSVLSGFEYDIFISYRHNDNLDGWVTDFVQNLEKELRSTLKDSLTIYFDKNPHDGLLETHNVDKSLEGKLKCLIFIPIISQTYCDTKSFAWQYEFVAFNRLASGHFPSPAGEGGLRPDEGRDIKLSNGNVASRILPIKIHDLDAEDKSLLESELGGVLRAIEFIYKESGVNRPLKSTDSKTDNQNKTDYRNQVNKVANAIKEIIAALKNPVVKTSGTIISKPIKIKANQSRNVIVSSVAVVLLMAIGTYWLYPKLFVSNKVDVLDKSIAVIPFVNIGKDPEQEYLSDGLSDELITTLGRISSLKVPGRTSSFEFKNKNIDLREIGRKLNVAYLLEGTVQKSGNKIRVNIKLIKASDGLQIWSYTYNTDLRDILQIQDLIASAIVEKLSIKLLQENTSQLDLVNREAYDLYLRGRYYWNRRGRGLEESLKYFKKAIELDPNFDLAYSGLADSYLMMSFLHN